MPTLEDSSFSDPDDPTAQPWWTGTRLKAVRHQPLRPGGRVALTLFEAAQPDGRPHPRMQTALPPVDDPFDGELLPSDLSGVPDTAGAFEDWLAAAWQSALDGPVVDIDMGLAPVESPQYYRNSIRAQRTSRFFARARRLVDTHVASGERRAARAVVRRLEARAFSGVMQFDDADTGTYHSFGKDEPFVHYLEVMLASLPADESSAMDRLSLHQQEAVRRQRRQATAHLDYLMRHKYARKGVWETDIEQRLGGLLIDRTSRRIVSETPESRVRAVPEYELLRVDPGAEHPDAGIWLHRNEDTLRREDGSIVALDEQLLRRIPVEADALTFQRAKDDPRLRAGIRFDWDGNGWLSPEAIGWVDWAGHCDIKAVMEQLGITLTGTEHATTVTEFRTDTQATTVYSRDLLVEMIASVMELGSLYTRTDGSGPVRRGVTRFGGARNDSRPDRLQFAGLGPRQSLRWPLSQRQDTLVVKSIEREGKTLDLGRVFHRFVPVEGVLDFEENPLFEKTIEGDYSLLDISGSRVVAELLEDAFDAEGYPIRRAREVVIDLRPDAGPPDEPIFLGAQMHDAAARTLWKVWLDVEQAQVDAKVFEVRRADDGSWTEQERVGAGVTLQLDRPLKLTLSREMKRDDPRLFQMLLNTAMRSGQNICADTDMKSEVWNGVVTRVESECVAEDRARQIEHWRIKIVARFGTAHLDFLLRRDDEGIPVAWCPNVSETDHEQQPDFLWQDFPDVGTKGRVNGDWVVNKAMLERGIITVESRRTMPGGVYVHDDHIKNIYEILFAGFSGYNFSIVHDNKRWGFRDKHEWESIVERLGGAGIQGRDEVRSDM